MVVLIGIVQPGSAQADPAAVLLHILVEDSQGSAVAAFGHDFSDAELTGIVPDVFGRGYTVPGGPDLPTGVSIAKLLGDLPVPLSPDAIAGATFDLGFNGPRVLSGDAHDFDDPLAAGDQYPFLDNLPPVFAPFSSGGQYALTFDVQVRRPGFEDSTLASGGTGLATEAAPMTMTLKLRPRVLTPTLDADPASAKVGQLVTFTAHVDNPDTTETPDWTWKFGDGGTADTHASPTATYRYTEPLGGDFTATAHLAGDHGSTGVATVTVHVAAATSPPPSTPATPPPTGASHGPGASNAPTVGPRVGDGPRVGGVVTGRPGVGSAGATAAARSPGATAAPTATGADARADGDVVGYLLSDATAVAVPQQAAPRSEDDAAPAARDGVSSVRIAGWLLGGGVVVVLFASGALSERRRPAHGRAHATRRRRDR